MNRNERGGVYIAVLGVTLFVTLVGLSAMLLVQTERSTREAVSESRTARTDARSAMEIALSRVAADDAWRTTHPSGTWTESETLGETKWGYVLEYDESAAADATVKATLTVGARRNESARFYSVDAMIPPANAGSGGNLCPNPDLEGSLDPWKPLACTLGLDSSDPHGGAESLAVSGRFIPLTGPVMEMKDLVTDNTQYQISFWARAADGATETIRVSLTPMVGFTATEDRFDVDGVDKNWTRVTGRVTADWADGDTPDTVTLRIQTVGTTTNFWIDDVEITEVPTGSALAPIELVSGSFRQRVME